MNLSPKCSSWKVPVRYLYYWEKKVIEGLCARHQTLTKQKKNFSGILWKNHSRQVSLIANIQRKVVHNSILNIFAFYIFDLSSTVQLQSRVFCRCRFRKFRKRAKNAFFCSFFTKEIDEVSHRAICSQCYYCLFNSTHLAKKNFEFRWCVQSQQIFMSTTRPGFFVGFDFRMQICIPIWTKHLYTQHSRRPKAHTSPTKQYKCIHMYNAMFLCAI